MRSTLYAPMIALASSLFAHARPVHLRCEYLDSPVGIDIGRPSLSWQSDNPERNWKQSAYQIFVASRADLLAKGKADVWDSGKVRSDESVGISYAGPDLKSRQRYYWTVRIWDGHGHASQAAEPAFWEMALLQRDDWMAKWIRWQNPEDTADRAGIRWIWIPGQDAQHVAPGTQAVFHLDFQIAELPERAALFLIAHGDWKASVNGHDAGAKPHWNQFDRRDIGAFLAAGENSIDITVTIGQPPEFGPGAAPKGTPQPAGLAALVKLTRRDGQIERISTDEHWQVRAPADASVQAAAVIGSLDDIAPGATASVLPQPAALLRKEFSVSKQVRQARVYATALGAYQMYINGDRVGRDLLTPGFTEFARRVQYQTYDVTGQIASGRNALGVILGDGWFGSAISWTAQHFKLLPPTRFLAQLEIEYTDGTRDRIVTDESWKAAQSPILHSEIYAGETYDARLEQPDWNKREFDDTKWSPVIAADSYTGTLSAQIDTPPRVVMSIKPERVNALVGGSYVFDMGQNMVGWVALKVKGVPGATIRLRFAEILNPDGTIYTTNLRNADATDTYTIGAGGAGVFTPRFTFHGFRYVEVSGYPGAPSIDDVSGEVVSSLEGAPAARVVTSSELVNRMWKVGIWGQRGNFLSVPTDCPQRDERLGWMADAAVFWRTGSYNFAIAPFTHKWTRDIRDAQLANGAFTNVSPNIGLGEIEGAPGWGDAGVIVPWTAWLQYGDREVIERNWDAMQRWMQFIADANPNHIRKQKVGPDFSDWLAPDRTTSKDLVDTAYWALIAQMMADMASAIGKPAEAKTYSELYESIRAAFQVAYVGPDGTVGNGTQTSYVVALEMKLLPPALESAAVDKLVANIEAHNWHLTTGFLGTPFLLFALSEHGHTELAYRLLLTDTYPSWGYMLSKGATTWWERWNGDTGDPSMNSYNHYAFGSVVAWVYRCVAGMDTVPTGAGFHEIVIHPHPDSRITSARGEYASVYGRIVIEWNGTPDGPFTLKVSIPANTRAKVVLPAIARNDVTEQGHRVATETENGARVLRIGSGTYSIEVR
jgi:alpha-L-rhamnosidase